MSYNSSLTDAQLRAAAVPVSGTVGVSALGAGSAIIGKVGIDQTTPGTTNKVSIGSDGTVTLLAGTAAFGKLSANAGVTIGAVEIAASQTLATVTNLAQLGGAAIAMGTGVRSAGTQRVTIATDDLVPVSGPLTDAQLRASSIPVSDAGGSLTVDAPVATPVFVRLSDGAAPITTLPVSGPLTDAQIRATALPVSAASLPLPTGAATETTLAALNTKVTAVNTGAVTISTALPAGNNNIGDVDIVTLPVAFNSGVTSATTQRVTLATDVALPTGANVIGGVTQSGTWNVGTVTTLPALPANQSVNVAQMNGVTVTMGSGVTGTGVQRVVLATDVALPTGANVIGALSANQSVNTAQIGGVTVLTGNGATGTGAARVTLSSDQVSAAAALADALANPTLGQQAVLNSVFNGTTWDRQRGMSGNLTTGDTGAKTATGNGATLTNVGNKGVQILFAIGTVTGTTPTFVGKVQGSVDGGTTFFDIPGATTASLVATGNWGIMVYPGIAVTAGTTTTGTTATANMALPRTWRVVWTIGGTTPSFTITNIQYNYLPN